MQTVRTTYRLPFLSLVLGLFCLLSGCAGTEQSTSAPGRTSGSTPSQADASFVALAGSNGLLQVQLSELAAQKSANLEVQEFAKLMAQQHSKINAELKTIARQERLAYPATLRASDKEIYDRLAKLSAPAFEQAYAREMEMALQQDVTLYQNAIPGSTSLTLRAFALKNAPVLRASLQLATQLKNVLP